MSWSLSGSFSRPPGRIPWLSHIRRHQRQNFWGCWENGRFPWGGVRI